MQTGNKFLAGSLVSGGNWQTVSSGVKVVGAAVTHWRGKARQVLPVISPAQPQSAQLAVQCGPPGGAHRPAPDWPAQTARAGGPRIAGHCINSINEHQLIWWKKNFFKAMPPCHTVRYYV